MRIPWLALVVVLGVAGPALAASCVPSCDVSGTLAAFLPPVTLVESGATVTWASVDVTHTATAVEAASGTTPCFNAFFTSSYGGTATLLLSNGAVVSQIGQTFRTCTGATALGDGSYALRYICAIHRNMNAELVVRPEG